jgi:hypothetical protein
MLMRGLRYSLSMEPFKFIAATLPYLAHPLLVLVGCVALLYLVLLQRVADPAIVEHLTQEGAATMLAGLMRYGFAVVCLAVVVAAWFLSSGG